MQKNKDKCETQACQESGQSVTNPQSAPNDQNSAEGARRNEEVIQSEKPPKSPWSFLFECLLVVATCTSAGVAYFQWQAMKSQSDIMKGQLETMNAQTKAAFQQVSAAKSSLKIADKALKDSSESGIEQSIRAEKALNATIENFRLDQRAWISVKDAVTFKGYTASGKQIFIKAGHPINLTMTYTNTGKTPARILDDKLYLYVMKSGEKPPLNDKAILASTNQPFTLFPGNTLTRNLHSSDTYSSKQIDVLRSGQYIMYIYGMIPYEDVFGITRWTQYCFYVNSDLSRLTVCSFYNENDKSIKYK